jgi:zinc transport system permease protein
MLDDFFSRAVLAGLALAAVAGPMGCFVVWRRLSYFGDTMAHAALLGVAMSLLFQINLALSVFAVAMIVAILVLLLQRRALLPSDAFLGLLSHGALALGLVAISLMSFARIDLNALLFGDILAVSKSDLAIVFAGGGAILSALVFFWRPLLALSVNREISAAEGISPNPHDLLFMLLLAALVAVAIKIVGALLITAMLIIPAAAARQLAPSPLAMAIISVLAGAAAVIAGLFASLQWNTPSGPSIIVAAVAIFVAALLVPQKLRKALIP